MTPELAMWIIGGVLGTLVAVLGFIAAWQFTKIIKQGERITAHDIEIITLRAQLQKTEDDLRTQDNKNENLIAASITKLEATVAGIGHSIEGKVNTLHGRLDAFLIDSKRPAQPPH